MTLGTQWAWKPDDQVKSLKVCLQTLVQCAGGDGNLLLNVGPMPDGRIEPRQAERLKEMGDWLRKHGESIYATRGGPFMPGPWGASTRKGSRIYVHVMKWTGNTLELPALPARVVSARALTGGEVEFQQTESGLTLRMPSASQDDINTLIALELDKSAMEITPVAVPVGSTSPASQRVNVP